MTNEQLPRVSVSFHTSSQRGGGVAHTIRVDEGAVFTEAERVYKMAWGMHCQAIADEERLQELLLAAQLEASGGGKDQR